MKKLWVWPFQIIAAFILFPAAWAKFTPSPGSVHVFTELGMEPEGRILVGAIEMLSAVFLLTDSLSAFGALFAFGTMLGAVIAHFTVLGLGVEGDGGRHVLMLAAVLISSGVTTYARRKQLPLIGSSF